MINQERIVADFMELVQIYSPTKNERQFADLLTSRLKQLGCTVIEDNAGQKIEGNTGNLIAYLRGSLPQAPIIMLGAHMDCVSPCEHVRPQRNDGRITSAGDTILGADDKAGIAAILEALRSLGEQQIPHGDIQIVFTIAEEGGLHGAKHIDRSLLKADLGFEFDSSGHPGEIITKAPGQNQMKITIHGKAAHAGIAPEAGINAIKIAGLAIAQINQGRIDEETTANIGIIRGGIATNIVPEQVEVICEARSRNLDKLQNQTHYMCELFNRTVSENGGTIDIDIERKYDPYLLAENARTVTLAYQAAKAAKLEPRYEATGGGSDANYFNLYGIETAVLGIGMQKCHTTEEFIEEDDLVNTANWIIEIVKAAANIRQVGQ